MVTEIGVQILCTLLVVLTFGAFLFPTTRPYARKYWWASIVVIAPALAYLVLRAKPRSNKAIGRGQELGDASSDLIDALVDRAAEGMAWADADLVKSRLQTERLTRAMETEIAAVAHVEDSWERRKALIKIVESYS